jgi:tetratricopeptide (TPR) repeat protein
VVGEPDLAIADYSTAINLDPNSAGVYYDRANAYIVTGNVILAIDDLTAFIRLRPSFPESYYKRGLLYGELGDKDKAGGDFRKTLELEPSYAPASHALTRLDEMVHPGVGKPENLPPGSP